MLIKSFTIYVRFQSTFQSCQNQTSDLSGFINPSSCSDDYIELCQTCMIEVLFENNLWKLYSGERTIIDVGHVLLGHVPFKRIALWIWKQLRSIFWNVNKIPVIVGEFIFNIVLKIKLSNIQSVIFFISAFHDFFMSGHISVLDLVGRFLNS